MAELRGSPFPLFRLPIGESRFFGRFDEARLLQIRKPERLREEPETACECLLTPESTDNKLVTLQDAPSSIFSSGSSSTHQFEARTSNHCRPWIESDCPAGAIRVTCQADERVQSTIAARFRSIGVEGLPLRFGRGEIPDQEASVYRACGTFIAQ